MRNGRIVMILVLSVAVAGCFPDPNELVFNDSTTFEGTAQETDGTSSDLTDSDEPPDDTSVETDAIIDSDKSSESTTKIDTADTADTADTVDSAQTDQQSVSDTEDETQTPVGCEDNPCDENADCDDSGQQVVCECRPGFEGDGQACEDLDECDLDSHDCDLDATCTNTPGSFTCECNEGYAGDGNVCEPSACETVTCGANAHCTDVGGLHCVCAPGHAGDPEVACTDVDECARSTDDCDSNATCSNAPAGSYSCTCKDGYAGDGKTCTDVNECETGDYQCGANEICSNTIGTYTCVCKDGYTRVDGECVYSRCDTTTLSQPETDCVRVTTGVELNHGCALTRVNTTVDGTNRISTSTAFTCTLGVWAASEPEVTAETCAGCEVSKETTWTDSCGNLAAAAGACCLTTGNFSDGRCGSPVPEAWIRSGCLYTYNLITKMVNSVGWDWVDKRCEDGTWVLVDADGDGGSCHSNCPEYKYEDTWSNSCGSQGDFEESCN